MNGQLDRHIDRKTERQTDKQTEVYRQTQIGDEG